MTPTLEFYAPCPRGTEGLLGDELRRLRVGGVRPLMGGVSFSGELADGYRALLWSRLASRVLLVLGRVSASDSDELYASIGEIPWEEHVRAGGTIAVDANGVNDGLRNTQFTAVRVKDAIADRFMSRFGRRPSVNVREPDVRVNVALRKDRATVSVDLAGTALHRRGYREPGVQVEAPMKETLAAAMLTIAEWPRIAEDRGAFVDPMCGSGTLVIEAAMMAGDVAPGLRRAQWGFDGWLGHDAGVWDALVVEAHERRRTGLEKLPPIEGYDLDARAVDLARSCARRAGLERHVVFGRRAVSALEAPESAGAMRGLVATNPPYGERISAQAGLPALYRQLADGLRAGFDGWQLAVITPDAGLEAGLGMRAERAAELYNGKIRSLVSVFAVGDGGSPDGAGRSALRSRSSAGTRAASPPSQPAESSLRAERPAPSGEPSAALGGDTLAARTPGGAGGDAARTPAREAFENRLRKMVRHREKWARRTGVSCYRVYDADLPDYAVAIDVYSGARGDTQGRWAHIAEYAPPSEIDPAAAERRIADVLEVVPTVLGISADDVFVKRRERQRGSAQYARVSRSGVVKTVEEGGLVFEVNLSDYLDTGIFLDHRMTRAWLRELAERGGGHDGVGLRFLNLFAYTATASVYAAAGGAVSSVSVDLSATYVEWARRNLALNGFGEPTHRVVREDVLEWVRAAAAREERFDLVFCDPPTFSNSKRMTSTWDVQRDHAELILDIAKLLAEGGMLVFSCNRRGFALDREALEAAGLVCEDVTARTIPPDFDRRLPHVCWTMRRSGQAE